MARMPGAIWRPLAADWASQPRMRAYDFFCLHTMVGGLDGTDGYFRNKNGAGYGGTESHFGVGPDGTIFQWQDTDFQADANGNGNWHVISSENADTGAPFPAWGGSDVPAMTPEQVEANAQIAAWLYRTHGIPLDLTPDSKPGRRGLAVHRWGVPGYMVAGAEQWSTAKGKACPGGRRIAQAPLVSARAKQIVGGAPAAPVPEEDDVLTDTQAAQLAAVETMSQLLLRQHGLHYQLGGKDHGKVTVPGWPQLGGRTLVDAIAFVMKTDDQPVDTEQVAEAIAAHVIEQLDGKTAATAAELEQIVRGIFSDAGTR